MAGDEPIVYDVQNMQMAFQTVKQFGTQINKLGTTLTSVHEALQEHLSGDTSGVGRVVASTASDFTGVAGKVFTEGGRVISEMGLRGHNNAGRMQNTEDTATSAFNDLHNANFGDDAPSPGRGGSSAADTGGMGGGSRPSDPTGSPDVEPLGSGDPVEDSKPLQCRPGSSDPVDLVTGAMFLPQSDLVLPGTLMLSLERVHISSYRKGGFFGPTWASTLDQRVEIDDDGIHYAAPDGMVLHYPVPTQPGQEVRAAEGARWPLSWDRRSDTIRIRKPAEGLDLTFPASASAPAPAPAPIPASAAPRPASGVGQVRPLGAVTDRNGNRITFHHDEKGLPALVEHSGGYRVGVLGVLTGAGWRVEELRLLDAANGGPGTLVRRFDYDAHGCLTQVVDCSDLPQIFEYDAKQRITAWIDRCGFRYDYEYDGSGRVVRAGGSEGFYEARFAYDTTARTTVHTDSLGNETTYHWDERGQVVKVTDAVGGHSVTERDRYDRVTARIDPLGRITRSVLADDGRPLRVEHPGGRVVEIEYGEQGLPVRMARPGGAEYRYNYDERGNRLTVTGPLGFALTTAYDERGGVASVTDALGVATGYRCDRAGLPVEIAVPGGGVLSMRYGSAGLPVEITDVGGLVTRMEWRVDGKPLWRQAGRGPREEWAYDGEGNLTEHRDTSGGVTRYKYGPFDTLTARIDPGGVRHEFGYDTERRLTSVTEPGGKVWSYEYDAVGRLVRELDFTGRSMSYRYDAAGQLAAKVNGAGQEIVYTRAEHGRIETSSAEGQVTRYEYDAAGRMLRAQGPASVLEYSYDALGRVVTESCDGRVSAYSYDVLGRRTSRITPSGAGSEWEFDEQGLPVALRATAGSLRFERDATGRERARFLGSRAATTKVYDDEGQLTGQAVWAYPDLDPNLDPAVQAAAPPNLLQQYTYTLRQDGLPEQSQSLTDGPRDYLLDGAGRATAVTAQNWRESYAYDALGNLTYAQYPGDPDAQGEFGYQGSLLRSAGRTSYEYDRQNRLIRKTRRTLSGQTRTWTFAWDAADRLIQAVTPDAGTWRYTYDPNGRRTAKRRIGDDGGVLDEVLFTWDGDHLAEQIVVEGGVGTVTTWDWQPGSIEPVAQTVRRIRHEQLGEEQRAQLDEAFYAVITDIAGTPSDLVDQDGRIAWHRAGTLWGASVAEGGGEVSCPLRFPGQYHDPETGLHYNVFRYYDPATAQYATPDPLRLLPGPNDRAYPANPLVLADPLGLATYGMVPLNDPSSEMAQVAMAARMQNGVSAGNNVAVYRIGDEPNHVYLAASSEGGGGLHSEEVLNNYLANNGISPDKVTAVYSERVPCVTDPDAKVQHNCAQIVAGYPNAQDNISFSLSSDQLGRKVVSDNKSKIRYAMANYSGVPSGLPGYTWAN